MMFFFFVGFICAVTFLYHFVRSFFERKKSEEEIFNRDKKIYATYWGTFVASGLCAAVRDQSIGFMHDMLTALAVGAFFFIFFCLFQMLVFKKKLGKVALISFVFVFFMIPTISALEPKITPNAESKISAKERAEQKAEQTQKALEEEENAKIADMNAEEKVIYEQKFAEYQSTTDVATARTKAIADVETYTEAKKNELQDLYDKQEQYEEWMAWKESERLKDLYAKQEQYEEWIAWQEEQAKIEAKKQAEIAEANKPENQIKRIKNAVGGSATIEVISNGNGSYDVIVTEAAGSLYKHEDILKYGSTDEAKIRRTNAVEKCRYIVNDIKKSSVPVNNITIHLTGRVTNAEGYQRTDDIVICEISGGSSYSDNSRFLDATKRFWTIRGL